MAWKDQNKRREYQREYIKRWRLKNPNKKYTEGVNRKENKRIALGNWRKRHPEKHRQNSKIWRINNMKYVVFMNDQRRIKMRGVEGKHTYKEWSELKEEYHFTCPCCKRKEPEIKLTEDHIIPISMGGHNNIENIQPLCGQCNSKKYKQSIKYEKP